MPYLSRVWINPLRAKGRQYLANPRIVHAAVLGGFVAPPQNGRLLWRLSADADSESGRPLLAELLVLSPIRASFEHIVEETGFPGTDEGQPHVRDYQALLDAIQVDGEFAFRTRVNPVESVLRPTAPSPAQQRIIKGSEGSQRGFRLPHRTVGQQTDWFVRRSASRWGFVVPSSGTSGGLDMRVVGRDRFDFVKGSPTEGAHDRVRIETVVFEGRLRVTDAVLFRDALLNGLGPAKAYGCGLLTLAPIAASAE